MGISPKSTKSTHCRDANPDDVDGRIDRLWTSESRINGIRKNINSMMSTLRGRLSQVRDTISAIETGIAFEQGSYLELQPPPKIEELAIKTHVKLFFNVTQSELNPDGKAFILYLGNVEDTFMTDDFMAVEVIENGYVKLTINMGAQVTELTSNAPIDYNEWHELIIELGRCPDPLGVLDAFLGHPLFTTFLDNNRTAFTQPKGLYLPK